MTETTMTTPAADEDAPARGDDDLKASTDVLRKLPVVLRTLATILEEGDDADVLAIVSDEYLDAMDATTIVATLTLAIRFAQEAGHDATSMRAFADAAAAESDRVAALG